MLARFAILLFLVLGAGCLRDALPGPVDGSASPADIADAPPDLAPTCEGMDLLVNPANCGACGNKCIIGDNAAPRCVAGKCGLRCAQGYTNCDGNLANGCEVDTDNDLANCGGCGKVCGPPDNRFCLRGSCFACLPPLTDCSGECVDIDNDPQHCGTCWTVCAPGQVCHHFCR